MQIIQIASNRMTVLEVPSCPSLDEQRQLLSTHEQPIEIVDYLSNRLGDPNLVILCSAISENLPLTAIDPFGKELFGNLLVVRKVTHVWGYALSGLTRNQIASVRQELRLARAIASHQEDAIAEASVAPEPTTGPSSFCPSSPNRDEVSAENQAKEPFNPAQAETSQTLRYLEDRVIVMGLQLDRLLDTSSDAELSAIAQSYASLEPEYEGLGDVNSLALVKPGPQSLRASIERLSQKQPSSIMNCFQRLQKKLLIIIDSDSHEVTLSFAFRPIGPDFEPIKELCVYESSWLVKQFRPSEFTLGFVKICDLRQFSWAIAMAYKALGYSCRIECESEWIDVDVLLAEASPNPLWRKLEAKCA
jgi:hypothetical protein